MVKHSDGDRPAFPHDENDGTGGHWMTHPGLTAREHAAIALRVPDSGQEWLDDMIREARRMDAAEAALMGQLAFSPRDSFEKLHQPAEVAERMYEFADALLAALAKTEV